MLLIRRPGPGKLNVVGGMRILIRDLCHLSEDPKGQMKPGIDLTLGD